MKDIPDVDPERIKLYGSRFIKLSRAAWDQYEALTSGHQEIGTSSSGGVVEISDDDDDNAQYEPSQQDINDGDGFEESSSYFQQGPPEDALQWTRECEPS